MDFLLSPYQKNLKYVKNFISKQQLSSFLVYISSEIETNDDDDRSRKAVVVYKRLATIFAFITIHMFLVVVMELLREFELVILVFFLDFGGLQYGSHLIVAKATYIIDVRYGSSTPASSSRIHAVFLDSPNELLQLIDLISSWTFFCLMKRKFFLACVVYQALCRFQMVCFRHITFSN